MGIIVNLEVERETERDKEKEIPSTPLALDSLPGPTSFNNSMHDSVMGYRTHYNYLNNFHH